MYQKVVRTTIMMIRHSMDVADTNDTEDTNIMEDGDTEEEDDNNDGMMLIRNMTDFNLFFWENTS